MSCAGVRAAASVAPGDPTDVLDQAAHDQDARLLVGGSHRPSRIAAAFVGSVSRRLVLIELDPTLDPLALVPRTRIKLRPSLSAPRDRGDGRGRR